MTKKKKLTAGRPKQKQAAGQAQPAKQVQPAGQGQQAGQVQPAGQSQPAMAARSIGQPQLKGQVKSFVLAQQLLQKVQLGQNQSITLFDEEGLGKIVIEKPGLNFEIDRTAKLGDTIYFTLVFTLIDSSEKEIDISSFFFFNTDTDIANLKVTILESVITFQQQVTLSFKCLLDLSNLIPGDKIFHLCGYQIIIKDSTEITPVEICSTDAPLYVEQASVSSIFQRNIASQAAIGDDQAGSVQEKAKFSTFLPIGLQPIRPPQTEDIELWIKIKRCADALSFTNYSRYMGRIFCNEKEIYQGTDSDELRKKIKKLRSKTLPFVDTDSYNLIKIATEAFIMVNLEVYGDISTGLEKYLEAGKRKKEIESIKIGKETIDLIPYFSIIYRQMGDIKFKPLSYQDGDKEDEDCYEMIVDKLRYPCFLELLWSYWHEESMLVQGLNAVCRRFQNIKGGNTVDPLANLEIGPLRPLNNLLWGYIQDEQHRLTVRRRAYEYDHHYGITLQGKAVQGMNMADSRSKFIEAFHTLLNITVKYYKQHDDTTVDADAFPVLNALKEVHMILSEGAHNQFGDLPSTARIEMMIQQYILARPEFKLFLPIREMVPYPEPWMSRTAVLNQLLGWSKTNVMHYWDLGRFGEQILLSIRFGGWSNVSDRDQAATWALFWRSQIQNYIHAYRAVTGVDLTREDGVIDIKQPSIHLVRRLKEQSGKIRA